MHLAHIPFILHAAIETAAAWSFVITPEKQLSGCSEAARLILQQYGGLLLSSNFICLAVILHGPLDGTSRWIAFSLGTYHFWPCSRALKRIKYVVQGDSVVKTTLGGPVVHLVVHVFCLAMFMAAARYG
jgi:hypothetical protein